MRAELKRIWSLEIEDSAELFRPIDCSNFGTWLRLQIGPTNEAGAESFDVLVCTPEWLKTQFSNAHKVLSGKNMLILSEFDLSLVRAEVSRWLDESASETWTETARKLGRFAAWEFEDYKGRQHAP